ncbi:hypothetical protein [Algoriphagus persicinus]|uniref:hypothetical protein n=1 Tax=Algoriphagus persicinus TaxID=3108754 RepID=UPI002B39FD99|nr:hypothetical protein [Algoriphagus sp. E1-3-M2]MEB2784742.1 hypothetical protein [Algoriphagus sp. E1-3-M2]
MKNILEIFIIFLTFNGIILLVNSVKNKLISFFELASLVILLLISIYAVWKTLGFSIYTFSILTIGFYFYKTRKKFFLIKPNLQDLLYANLIWLPFALIYFVMPGWDFGYPHEDYIIYSRIAYYNDRFGVENTQTFYNLISNPGIIEVYHYAELWLSSFFKRINGLSFIPNLILISYPLMAYLLFLGINDLLKNQTKFHAFLVTSLILLVFNPYDEVLRFFNIGLPLVGFSSLIFNLKTLFILPPIILTFKGIIDDNPNYPLIGIFGLFYPLIIPVLFVGLGFYELSFGKRSPKNILIIAIVLVFFGLFSLLFKLSGTEISFKYFFDLNVMSKVFWIIFFIPSILLMIPLYYLYKFKKIETSRIISFSCLIYLIGGFFYVLLFENIDANQMFRNTASPLFSVLLGFGIYFSFKYNQILGLFLIMLFCSPLFFNLFYSKNIIVSDEIVNINNILLPYKRIVYVPSEEYVYSIYHYNERFYIEILDLFLIRKDLDLINISASFPKSPKINNSVSENMLSTYKNISPFSNFCKDWTFQNVECLIDFAESVNAEGILVNGNHINFPLSEQVSIHGNFKLLIFNN